MQCQDRAGLCLAGPGHLQVAGCAVGIMLLHHSFGYGKICIFSANTWAISRYIVILRLAHLAPELIDQIAGNAIKVAGAKHCQAVEKEHIRAGAAHYQLG